jgi:hypothetical protein
VKTLLNGDKVDMDTPTQAMIDTAKEAVGTYDQEMLSGMSEAEMAEAIGRLAGTLGMLIAAVDQPRVIS